MLQEGFQLLLINRLKIMFNKCQGYSYKCSLVREFETVCDVYFTTYHNNNNFNNLYCASCIVMIRRALQLVLCLIKIKSLYDTN